MPLYPRSIPTAYSGASGFWQTPAHYVVAAGTTITSGTVSLLPFDVSPVSRAYSGLGVGVTVAQSGGTTTTTLAAYADDGSGGLPRLVGGPLVSGTCVLTATGNAKATFAWTPSPGRYWLAFLYVASVAPTTAPQLFCVSNSVSLWVNTLGNSGRGLQATGLSAMPTTQIALSSISGATGVLVAAQAT